MGHLLAGYAVKVEPDPGQLEGLRQGLQVRIFAHTTKPLWFIELPAGPIETPFITALPAEDFSSDVRRLAAPFVDAFAIACEALDVTPGVQPVVNMSLRLAQRLGHDVFGFIADDDLLEFACICGPKGVRRMRCGIEILELACTRTGVTVTPFALDDDPELEPDLRRVLDRLIALPAVKVSRRRRSTAVLHGIPYKEIERFAGTPVEALGLCGASDSEIRLVWPETAAPTGPLVATVHEFGWVRRPVCRREFQSRNPDAWDGTRHLLCGAALAIAPRSRPRPVAAALDAVGGKDNRALCPTCGAWLSLDDPAAWTGSIHVACGQRLNIIRS